MVTTSATILPPLEIPLVKFVSAMTPERWAGGPLSLLWEILRHEATMRPGVMAWRVLKHDAQVGLRLNADRSATLEFQRAGPFKLTGAVPMFSREVAVLLKEFGYGPMHFPVKVFDGRNASPPYLRVVCSLPSKVPSIPGVDHAERR